MPNIIDPKPQNTLSGVAVRGGQPVRLTADGLSDWYQRVNGSGSFALIASGSNVATITLTPAQPTRVLTFDVVELAVVTHGGAAPTVATLYLHVCAGPVALPQVASRVRDESMSEPPLNPDALESDDPPLGFPLAMPGANRDGLGTVRLESVYEASGPSNTVSLYGPGVLVDTAGNLSARTPGQRQRGLGPFPTFSSWYHTYFYFNYDFGRSRTIGLTRVLYEDNAAPNNVAIVRGDGRRNTYRYFNFNGGVTYYTSAASLKNVLLKSGSFFQETTPTGKYFLYNSAGSLLPSTLNRVIDRYGNAVYYSYDVNSKLQLVQGPTAASSGMVAYLAYNASGLLGALTLRDSSDGTKNRTTYFTYDGNRNATVVSGPELCSTTFAYNTPLLLQSIADAEGFQWYFTFDSGNRVTQIRDTLSPAQTAYYAYDGTTPATIWQDRAGKVSYFAYNAFGPTYAYQFNTPADYYSWDGDGDLVASTNRLGNAWTYQYDSNGNRISATDPLGARWYYAYDSLNDLRLTIDPLGRINYLTFDAQRNRTAQQDPLGNTTYYAYQSTGLMSFKKDRRGNFTYFGFDGAANLTAVKDAFGYVTYMGYNSAGDRTSMTDPLLRTSYWIYDKRDRVEQTQDPVGAIRYWQWNDRCDVIAEIDPRGFTTYHTYDGNQNRIQTLDPLLDPTYFTFDPEDRLASRTDARLNTTSWKYDVLGRRQVQTDPFGNTRYWAYDAAHEGILSLDENQNPTYADYDAVGRMAHSKDAFLNVTYSGYDLKGNRVLALDKRANPTYWTYENRDLVQFTRNAIFAFNYMGYDQELNRTASVDALGQVSYVAYDARNMAQTTTDPFGFTTYSGYDGARQGVLRLDQLGVPTYMVYDLAGRQQHTIDAYQNLTYLGYDLSGNLVVSANQRGFATYMTYDADNRQLDSIDLGELRRLNTYDAVGNVVQRDEEQGWGRQPWGTSPYGGERVTTYFTFDALNRTQTSLSPQSLYSVNVSLTYTGYDKAGNRILTHVENPVGGADVRNFYYDFDALNRQIHAIDPPATTGAARGVQYFGFDAVSNRVLMLDQESRATYFTYDPINRQTQQTNGLFFSWVTYYDARNSVVDRIDPAQRWAYTSYDNMARVSTQSNMLGQVTYMGYDPRSSRVLTVNPRGFPTHWTLDRLARTSTQTDALGGVRYFGYDPVGNKVLAVDERSNPTYWAFDQANRVRMMQDALGGQFYYAYDAAGSLRQKTDADGRYTSFGYFGYDASRRPTTMSFDVDPWIYYAYDSLGNLLTTKDETGTSVTYYDFLNRVTQKTTLGGTVYYQYDRTGTKTLFTDPGLFQTYYGCDAAGRLSVIQLLDSPVRTSYYVYDPSGLFTTKLMASNNALFPQSLYVYYLYDNAGRSSNIQNWGPNSPTTLGLVAYYAYSRNPNGGIEQIVHEGGTYTYYRYDALDRLVRDERWNSSNVLQYGFLYNYDAATNRYFVYDEKANSTTYYSYDADNLLQKGFTLP